MSKGGPSISFGEEWFSTTLKSIGDAVIATDDRGRVLFMNPVAEALTGWAQAEVRGKDLLEVFRIINEFSREPVEDPVAKVIATGHRIGLANHTTLIARDGTERPIDDSAAPIIDGEGRALGVVLVFRDVSEKRRAEELREHLAAIVASSDDAIVSKNLDGVITSWNKGAERILGYTAEEAVGKHISMLMPEDHLEDVTKILGKIRRGERVDHYETKRMRKDGRVIDVSLTVSPIRDSHGTVVGASKVARDITGRKRADERLAALVAELGSRTRELDALSRSAQQLNKVLEVPVILRTLVASAMELATAEMGTAGVLRDGKMYFWEYNDRGKTYPIDLVFERDDARGLPSWVMRMRTAYVANDAANDDVIRPDLQRRFGIDNAIGLPVFDRRGELIACFELHNKSGGRPFTDNDLKALQGLAASAAIALENARLLEKVREGDRRKDEFLAMLAHELRNPLSAISNAALVLERSDEKEHHEWSREVILNQVGHLARMIDDLLDVSRITRGKIQLRMQPLNLVPIVNSAVESVRPLFEERKHKLTVALDSGPMRVKGDPTRLEQVLVNLLTNAAKYTESAGRTLLSAEAEGEQIIIRVKDNGIGMTPELLVRAFDLFAQGDRSIARSEGGLGIGLTLVKSLVEMHDGTVSASSAGPGTGSEFTVCLPMFKSQDLEPSPASKPSDPGKRSSRVLVVDDNVDTAQGLAKLLKLLGHDVAIAHSGPSALELTRSHQPDVILLDIGLPGMDGYEVAQTLRNDGFSDTVIIAVSGYGEEQAVSRSFKAGFNYHLVKPVDLESLIALLGQPQ